MSLPLLSYEGQAADAAGRLPDAPGVQRVPKVPSVPPGGTPRRRTLSIGAALASGAADAVAWGKDYIANPDLETRFKKNAPLNKWDAKTFYSAGPQGYTDYPALESVAAE